MDKSLLNVAGIIAFVFGIICCCTIIGAIVGVPMIIGGNKLREYSNMSDEELRKNKDNFLVWTIVLLIICTIAGVIALIVYIQLENPSILNSGFSSRNNERRYNDLEKLNQLYKDKVLSKEEFEKEKERILNNL